MRVCKINLSAHPLEKIFNKLLSQRLLHPHVLTSTAISPVVFQKYAMIVLFESYLAAMFPSNCTEVVFVLWMSHLLSQPS